MRFSGRCGGITVHLAPGYTAGGVQGAFQKPPLSVRPISMWNYDNRAAVFSRQAHGAAVTIVTERNPFPNMAGMHRWMTVQTRFGELETRTMVQPAGGMGRHAHMLMPGEAVVGAGYYLFHGQGKKLRIDGDSSGFPTFLNRVRLDASSGELAHFGKERGLIAEHSGMAFVEPVIRRLMRSQVEEIWFQPQRETF